MLVIARTTLAVGRCRSSLGSEMAAMREMTILPPQKGEIFSRRSFASAALTERITMSALLTAASLSVEACIFAGRGRRSVEMFLLVTITLEILGDFAAALATASPIFPAPRTATIKAPSRENVRYYSRPWDDLGRAVVRMGPRAGWGHCME